MKPRLISRWLTIERAVKSYLPVNATEAADEDEIAEMVEEVCWMPAGGTVQGK